MRYAAFEARAREIFDGIPPEYREGVDGLEVSRDAVPHPTLPDVFTLGECRSEFYPSEFGGAGEVRSIVVLFHGSFRALSQIDEEFDWEGELWETVTHEVQHHLESLASEDALEEQDYAEDQNFARREGEPFDPLFYRAGHRLDEDVYEVGGDVFVERRVDPTDFRADGDEALAWQGRNLRVPRPDRLGDIHFVRVDGVRGLPGDLTMVFHRRRGAWESVRALFSAKPPEVLQSAVRAASRGRG